MVLRFSRLYSSVAKSKLAILRKRTGFPMGKCKEALVKSTDDLDAAEKWLNSQAQAEGWAKVEKLRDRAANQGLIGLLIRENRGAMIEVNCETDFVAKNENFQSLVSTAAQALFDHQGPSSNNDLQSTFFGPNELAKLETSSHSSSSSSSSSPLSDVVASTVGHLGENLVLQRGCLLTSGYGGVLCGEAYNALSPGGAGVLLGKYAALLHLVPTDAEEGWVSGDSEAIAKLGRGLGQHIIGINPAVINEGDEGISDPTRVLTKQNFVLDESLVVGDMLSQHRARATKFVRYALGET